MDKYYVVGRHSSMVHEVSLSTYRADLACTTFSCPSALPSVTHSHSSKMGLHYTLLKGVVMFQG